MSFWPFLRGCQTIDKVGRFSLPIKSAKNLLPVMQKLAHFVSQQNRPILSSNIECILFAMIKLANISVTMVIVYSGR